MHIVTMNMSLSTCHGSSYQPLCVIVIIMEQESHTMPTTEYCDYIQQQSINSWAALKRLLIIALCIHDIQS